MRRGPEASEEALDERTLRSLAEDPQIADRARGRSPLACLWDVCQTPDFRKTTFEDHRRLVGSIFAYVGRDAGRVPEDWMEAQFRPLDRLDGGIDALSKRLAGVRTLAYIAHRPDWLADVERWREATRRLEDRLSDDLHEKLMARFIDRRTSALIRGLGRGEDLLAGVAADGAVSVEGHFVGRLQGLRFEPAKGTGALAQKALRAAAVRAVGPEVARRLGAIAAEGDDAFDLQPDGVVLWRGEAAGVLANGEPSSPSVRLYGELGPPAARGRAARRARLSSRPRAAGLLAAQQRLRQAVAGGAIKGLARGLAWRLIESGGVLDRRLAEHDLRSLSQSERRALRSLGVRIGAFCLYLPDQLRGRSRLFARAFAAQEAPGWRIAESPVQRLPSPVPSPRALGLAGLMAAGSLALRIEALEALDQALRAAPRRNGGLVLTRAALTTLGLERAAMRARSSPATLSFAPVRPADGEGEAGASGGGALVRPATAQTASGANSPFAALAGLERAPPGRAQTASPFPPRPWLKKRCEPTCGCGAQDCSNRARPGRPRRSTTPDACA